MNVSEYINRTVEIEEERKKLYNNYTQIVKDFITESIKEARVDEDNFYILNKTLQNKIYKNMIMIFKDINKVSELFKRASIKVIYQHNDDDNWNGMLVHKSYFK